MISRNISQIGVLALAMLMGGGALISQAHQNDPPAEGGHSSLASVAVVDMTHLYQASGAPAKYDQKLVELEGEAEQQIRSIAQVPMLDQKEMTDYVTMATRASLTDAEQARMKELKGLSDQRAEELRTLGSKDDKLLVPADKTRLVELTDRNRVFKDILPQIANSVRADQKDRLDSFRQEQIMHLRSVVGQVAKSKGYTHVFDANSLVYSVNDVTQATLEQLAKHK